MNRADGAYALNALCPIRHGLHEGESLASRTRGELQRLDGRETSPMARVPETLTARFFILNDVFFQDNPAREDHLRSSYLVFSCDFHGELQPYVKGFWQAAGQDIKAIWKHCVGFDQVHDEDSFLSYLRKCQLDTAYYFNGSSGAELDEQLKALHLRQVFTEFVHQHQDADADRLQAAFADFVADHQPLILTGPRWQPGLTRFARHRDRQ